MFEVSGMKEKRDGGWDGTGHHVGRGEFGLVQREGIGGTDVPVEKVGIGVNHVAAGTEVGICITGLRPQLLVFLDSGLPRVSARNF